MDEKDQKDFKDEFNEEDKDPTKEAFFSDIIEMEEEIATEALSLVEHALQLVTSKYYDVCTSD